MQLRFSEAFIDLRSILDRGNIWYYLGLNDIKLRYAGSTLGPWWITLTMCLLIASFSVVYSRLLHLPIAEYIPFLTTGLLIWTFILTVITDSCDMFVNAKEYLHTISLPYSLFLYRVIWRNLLIFSHNFLVYLAVIVIFRRLPGLAILWFIPGFILLLISLSSFGLLIGLIATRYRDIPPIITAVMQMVFFVSPITWMPNLMGDNSIILKLNPLTYFLDLTRGPLLGQFPSEISFVVVIGVTLAITSVTFTAFSIKRNLIPFWL